MANCSQDIVFVAHNVCSQQEARVSLVGQLNYFAEVVRCKPRFPNFWRRTTVANCSQDIVFVAHNVCSQQEARVSLVGQLNSFAEVVRCKPRFPNFWRCTTVANSQSRY